MTLTCVDCGVTETLTPKDQERFDHLLKTVPGFQTPKRCNACRKKRRDEKPASGKAVVMKATPSISVTPAPAPPEEPPKILLVLATKDFDDLVHGRSVVWNGVKVLLADIGFTVMRKAIDDAELDKAKKHVKANGH
jgi:Probable zinc-ribbon domain